MSTQLASISNRLTSAQAQLLERSRVISLGIMPSPASTHSLVRTLTAVRGDLAKLSEEATFERTGLALGGSQGPGKASSGADAMALGELEARYDRLVDMLQADDDGRERAKALVRDKREPSPAPEPVDDPLARTSPFSDNAASPEPAAPQPLKPFRDYDDDEDEPGPTPHEMLSHQEQLMNDQDERLNLLSHSITRQNHLSVQIGDELDIHHELLEETDQAMDRTAARLNHARRRLDTVAEGARQHGSTITIVGLIVILLFLIIIFKT